MATKDLLPPPAPLQAGLPKTVWLGAVDGPGLPNTKVTYPVVQGPRRSGQAPTAWFRAQYRLEEGDWQPIPDVEATSGPVVLHFPETRFAGLMDLRVFAVSYDNMPSAPLEYLDHDIYELNDPPSALMLEPVSRTDATGTKTGVRASWTAEPGLLSMLRYRFGLANWVDIPPIMESSYEIVPAPKAGVWQIEVRQISPAGNPGPSALGEWTLEFGESDLSIDPPSGLEIVGFMDELQGTSREYIGRDLRVRWNSLRSDALETQLVGIAPEDELLEHVVVQVVDPDTEEVIRTEQLPISVTQWIYSYNAAVEDRPIADAGPTRMTTIRVAYKDVNGRFSDWMPITVEQTIVPFDTEDFASDAVSEFFTVLDDSSLDQTTAPLPYTGAFTQIAVAAWTAEGLHAVVHWAERSAAAVSVVSGETVKSTFRFTVRDMTLASNVYEESYDAYSATGFASSYTKSCWFPSLSEVVSTVVGNQYEARLEWARSRTDGASTINLVSTHRSIAVHEVKR